MKKLQTPLTIKEIGENGTFAGHGSVFGTLDSYNERVEKGAFAESLAKHAGKGSMPAMLWQHRHDEPIGVYTRMEEDDRGLYVEGKLLIDEDPLAKRAYAHMKAGSLRGLSIGYRIEQKDIKNNDDGSYSLKKIDLQEVSLVTFPANEDALVADVKQLSKRDVEATVRDVFGLSARQAKRFIADGWSAVVRDERDDSETVKKLSDLLNQITNSGDHHVR